VKLDARGVSSANRLAGGLLARPAIRRRLCPDETAIVALQVGGIDRNACRSTPSNLGLHHLFALKVVDRSALDALMHVRGMADTVVEFGPERSGKGPKVTLWCEEPGGPESSFACVSPARL